MSFFLSSRAVTYNCYGVRASGLQQTFHLVCLLLLATHSCSRRTSRPFVRIRGKPASSSFKLCPYGLLISRYSEIVYEGEKLSSKEENE